MSDSYMAHWSRCDGGRLVVADRAGKEFDSFAVPSDDDRPSPSAFFGAAWAPYPGSEWDEEPPAVFRGHDEIQQFFAGFDLVAPGLVEASHWRRNAQKSVAPPALRFLGGVGQKSGNRQRNKSAKGGLMYE